MAKRWEAERKRLLLVLGGTAVLAILLASLVVAPHVTITGLDSWVAPSLFQLVNGFFGYALAFLGIALIFISSSLRASTEKWYLAQADLTAGRVAIEEAERLLARRDWLVEAVR